VKRKDIKKQNLLEFGLVIGIVIIIGFISSFVFTRVDLTSEKRHTLSHTTKDYLRNLDNVVYLKVYLESDHLPAGLKRLQRSVKEMLDEFRVYANDNIEYSFINPTESTDQATRLEIVKQLDENGMRSFNLTERDKEGGESMRKVFPGAWITYRAHGQEYQHIINFYKEQLGSSQEQMINSSIEGLEYEFITAIQTLTKETVPRIGIIEGHGEWSHNQMFDVTTALENFYVVERVTIDGKLNALRPYKAVIIANPRTPYTQKDKYILDQYIMKGGRVFWAVDAVNFNMDNLVDTVSAMAVTKPSAIGDMFFTYGARVNSDLIQDKQCTLLPRDVSDNPNQSELKLFPWYYFPVVAPFENHPIIKNLNYIRMEFASSIDTLEVPDVAKTILLRSSSKTRTVKPPIPVHLSAGVIPVEDAQFNNPFKATSVLLEGKFNSHFLNRVSDDFLKNDSVKIDFFEKSVPTKMIIVSDGEAISNLVRRNQQGLIQRLPTGYDPYTYRIFGNKEFFLNCMNYLCDDSGFMDVRSREIKIRILDFDKITKGRTKWQLINLLVPVLLVALFGFFVFYFRRKKFAN